MRIYRFILTVILALTTSQAFAAASLTPAFSTVTDGTNTAGAGQQGTNTLKVVGATISHPGGQPTMTITPATIGAPGLSTANTFSGFSNFSGGMKASDIIAKGPWVDVRAFSTPSHPEGDINAAIASAVSRGISRVIVPGGTYTQPFTIPSGIHVEGFDSRTIFTIDNGANCDVVTFAEGATNASISRCVIDGNMAHQSAVTNYTAISPNGITVLAGCSKIGIFDCEIRNVKNWAVYLRHRAADNSTPGTSGVSIFRNQIVNCGQDAVFTRTASGLQVYRNYISNWGIDNPDTVAIKTDTVYGSAYDQAISYNRIKNVNSTRFAIEGQQGDPNSDSTWINRVYGLTVTNNQMDAGGLTGGNGVSELADDALYQGNVLTGGIGNWRNGFEVNGKSISVEGNRVDGGTIMISPTAGTVTSGVSIIGNDITHTAANSVGIQVGSNGNNLTSDVVVSGNTVDLKAATGSCQGIGVGGSSWGNNLVQRILVTGNKVLGPGASGTISGIYVGSAFESSDIAISNNMVSGFQNGVRTNAPTTNEITVTGNDVRLNAVPILSSATGTGYREFLNVTTSAIPNLPASSVLAGTSLTINNASDSDLDIQARAGSTVDKDVRYSYRDHLGTAKWYTLMEAASSNSFMIEDVGNASAVRMQLGIGGVARLNSYSDKAVQFNNNTNSGTAGGEVWSGGASPAKVWGSDGKGIVFSAIGGDVASGATIAPTGPIFHVTGTSAISTITPPATGYSGAYSGSIRIIPNGAFTTTTGGNIALASTAVVNKVLTMTYDAGTSKWYPNY